LCSFTLCTDRAVIVQDIDCPCFDWDSDWFVRFVIRIRIDLSGFRLGFRYTDQGNIVCFRNSRDWQSTFLSWNLAFKFYTPQHPLNIWDVQVLFKTYYEHVFWWGFFTIPPNGQFSQKNAYLNPGYEGFFSLVCKIKS